MTGWWAAVGWIVALASGAAAAVAWRALAARAEAVADACHELRGPLTSAYLGLELGVRVGSLSGAQVRAIELELKRAALALQDFGAEARDKPAPRRDWVGVRALVSDSVEAWRPAAAAGGSPLGLRWHGDEAWVIGDRLRLAQATGNLIANAIEHGGGAVVVRGRVDHGMVRIEVIDRGPGLPAPVAALARRPRAGRGHRGRGLAIAAGVAEAHGGRLAAAPSDCGARLVLELPLSAGSPARAPIAG